MSTQHVRGKAGIVHNGALLVLILASLISLTGFGCRNRAARTDATSEGIEVWGLWHESGTLDPAIKAFQERTNVKVTYKKLGSVANYERKLLEAFAEGTAPDVFVIHHTWVEGKRGFMVPAPLDVINLRQLQDEFVDVVAADLVRDGLVFALPTSVDSLAMFYHKDIFNAAGITKPPRTWQELQRVVEKLTLISRFGEIERSGVALGTAENINRASDIVQLLMMQSGLSIIDRDTKRIDFSNDIGQRALTFYTDFSNKSKKVFSWDLQQDYSLDAFAEGKVAMMFNYSYHIPTIQAKNPRVPFEVAPMPQVADSTPRTFANYWPYAVSSTSTSPVAAWHFIRFLSSREGAALIGQVQKEPPARHDGVDFLRTDPVWGVFAEQTLTAQTWPRADIVSTDAIFNTMIDDVVTGAVAIPEAVGRAGEQVARAAIERE